MIDEVGRAVSRVLGVTCFITVSGAEAMVSPADIPWQPTKAMPVRTTIRGFILRSNHHPDGRRDIVVPGASHLVRHIGEVGQRPRFI
jgi:hypothetical protein